MEFFNFSRFFLYLFLYSIFGWICEMMFCFVVSKRLTNRGFLKGPYCPIYGFGAILCVITTYPFSESNMAVFCISLLVCSALEYFSSWILEVLFQIRWWDYSNKKIQLNGRICLVNSILFGIMGLITVRFVHPLITNMVNALHGEQLRVFASFFMFIWFVDIVYTTNSIFKLKERFHSLQVYFDELESSNHLYNWFDRRDLGGSFARLKNLCEQYPENTVLNDVYQHVTTMMDSAKWKERHIINFPSMKLKQVELKLEPLQKVWIEQKQSIDAFREKFKNNIWHKTRHLSNQVVHTTAQQAMSFASGSGFYKLLWVFISASILGYIVETIFCLVTRGVIESRQGLLYGPFSQVYGLGAVLMVIFLTPLAKKNDRWLFCGSAILGGIFEYLCSLFQEYVFGTVSWEYSDQALSIGGRTSVTYMFFWGILGIVFMKGIYSRLSRFIERIPNHLGVLFSWLLVVVLSIDIALSSVAVYRWAERMQGKQPSNKIEELLDEAYPNDVLKEIYPNMQMVEDRIKKSKSE